MGHSLLQFSGLANYGLNDRRLSLPLLGLVMAAHALAILALQSNPVQQRTTIEQPILISLISPQESRPKIDPTPPVPQPSKPQPAKPRPAKPVEEHQQTPVHDTPAEKVITQSSPLPAAETAAPPREREIAATPQNIEPAAPTTTVTTAEPQPEVEPPRFNADYLDNPSPRYPPLSRRKGEEGRVMLRVFVEPNGLPSQIQLQRSSGFPSLDQSAQETVRQWKFIPARQGGQPQGAWVIVPIQFNLKG